MRIPPLHVGNGTHHAGVTVFPVWTASPSVRGLTTGTAAELEVGELTDGPSVPWLELTNPGDRAALVLEGELLEGGWQSRAVVHDVVLAPRSRIRVEVACVEQGRWGGGPGHLRRSRRVTPRVQHALREPEHCRQQRVWGDVQRYQSVSASPTASLAEQLTVHQERTATAPVTRPLPGQRGVLIGIGDQPLGLELFGSTAALAHHLGPLLDAALFEAAVTGVPAAPTPGRRARRLAARLELLDVITGLTDAGSGVSLFAQSPKLVARGVAAPDGRLAHLSVLATTHPLLEMTS